MLLEGRTIAVIEDDPIMGESLVQSLGLEGAKVRLYPCAKAVGDGAFLRDLDLIVCDIRLPDMDGRSLFRHLSANLDTPPFLFMTAYGEIDQAVALMREGAADYLTKPFEMAVFLRKVQSSLRPVSSASGDAAMGSRPPCATSKSSFALSRRSKARS